MKELADALNRIAEVHDRRLGEIGIALNKLAEAFTHYDDRDISLPYTGIDYLSQQIAGLDTTLGQAVDELTKHSPDSD